MNAHSARNSLTEHTRRYKYVNPNIMSAYGGITPSSLSKLNYTLFNCLLEPKKYFAPDAKQYCEVEDHRIYTIDLLTLPILLHRFDPKGFPFPDQIPAGKTQVLRQWVKELDELNMFYLWTYGRPMICMFFMERDVGVWRYYNQNGCVTPKTIIKVLQAAPHVIVAMERLGRISRQTSNVKIEEIRYSFMGLVNRLVKKMHPSVAKQFTVTREFSKIDVLLKQAESLSIYEGLTEHPSFLQSLPINIRNALAHRECTGDEKDNNETMLSIIPTNAALVKTKRRKTKKKIVSKKNVDPKVMRFKSIDPFKNCNELMKYYRAVIRTRLPNARFYPYNSERPISLEVWDVLIDNNRGDDRKFLKAWIEYFAQWHLNTERAKKPGSTSFKQFSKTFVEFQRRYMG